MDSVLIGFQAKEFFELDLSSLGVRLPASCWY